MVSKKTMLLEREDKPGIFQTLLSTLFLTILLSVVYYMKGGVFTPQSLEILANLKSLNDGGISRVYFDPIPTILLNLFRKFSSTSLLVPYQILLSLVFSSFLHNSLLVFYRQKWKLYHFFIVYLLAFSPFSLYLPFSYLNEIICITAVLHLIYVFEFEKITDLVNIIIFTLVAMFSDLGIFFFVYFVYVLISTLQKMQEKRSKTTVFFKKKNIPLRILLIYAGLFVIFLAMVSIFEFYGEGSLLVLLNKVLDVIFKLFPIFIVSYVLQSFLKLEEGAQEYVGALILVFFILGVGYYSFGRSMENGLLETAKIESEILSLRSNGKIPPQSIFFGRRSLRNPLYYSSGLQVESSNMNSMESKDYLILDQLKGTERQYLDRKNIPPSTYISYYFIDSSTLLLSKDFINRVLNDSDDSDLKKSILLQIDSMNAEKPILSERYYSFVGKLFGI